MTNLGLNPWPSNSDTARRSAWVSVASTTLSIFSISKPCCMRQLLSSLLTAVAEEGFGGRGIRLAPARPVLPPADATGRIAAARSESTGVLNISATVNAKPARRAALTNRISRRELPPRLKKSSVAWTSCKGKARVRAQSLRSSALGSLPCLIYDSPSMTCYGVVT